jgi:hypothetical protein
VFPVVEVHCTHHATQSASSTYGFVSWGTEDHVLQVSDVRGEISAIVEFVHAC